MPFIDKDAIFNPDDFSAPVIGIGAELGANHDSQSHQHQRAQLLFAPQGCMTVTLEAKWLILPPTRAAWIPENIAHRVQLRGQVAYRSIYFDTQQLTNLPKVAEVFAVNPLLGALIERVVAWSFTEDLTTSQNLHLLNVLQDEIVSAKREKTQLIIPADKRLKPFVGRLLTMEKPPSLTVLAQQLNLHEKTLTRLFKNETGLSYQQWCQQWKLMRAIELLAENKNVSSVAQKLSFSSDSAFIAFFRQFTGATPKQFMLYNNSIS